MLTGAFSGHWWLPEDPKRRVAGTLTIDWDRLQLDLIGSFVDPPQWSEVVRHDQVLGRTTVGKLVTLHDCVVSNISTSMATFDLPAIEVHPRRVLHGAHVLDVARNKFREARLDLERLTDWVQSPAMEEAIEVASDGRLQSARLTYEPPAVREFRTPSATVRLGMEWGARGDRWQERAFYQRANLVITHDEGLTLDEWLGSFVDPLRNLLTLATERPIAVDRLVLRQPTDAGVTPTAPEIEAVWRRDKLNPEPNRTLLPDEMLFGLPDLPDDGLARWLDASRQLGDALNLFFGVRYAPHMYVENQFLNVVQAAEVYHRRRFDGVDLPPDEHAKRIASIVDAVSEEQRKWLQEKLKYSNEPSLRRRLRQLVRAANSVMQPVVGNHGTIWVDRVVGARNFQTHRDPEGVERAVQGAALWELMQEVSVLMMGLLLHELGVSEDRAAEHLKRGSRTYQWAMGRRLAQLEGEEPSQPDA